jgi:hypothetical protein
VPLDTNERSEFLSLDLDHRDDAIVMPLEEHGLESDVT